MKLAGLLILTCGLAAGQTKMPTLRREPWGEIACYVDGKRSDAYEIAWVSNKENQRIWDDNPDPIIDIVGVGSFRKTHPECRSIKRKVRIEWRDANGNRGHGETCFTEREAAGILVGLARDYPDMQHWVSTCK